MVYLLDVIGQRRFQRSFCKAHVTLDPLPMLLGPRLDPLRTLLAVPQKELSEPVACFQLILLGRLPRPHQITQSLVCRVGHPDGRQLTSAMASRQLFCITAVGFDPVPGFGRNQGRRDHLASHAHLRELPVEHVPRRPGLIAGSQMLHRSQFVDQFSNRL